MQTFAVGDKVIVGSGARQGQEAEIIEIQRAHVAKVRMADDTSLFYSINSLSKKSGKPSVYNPKPINVGPTIPIDLAMGPVQVPPTLVSSTSLRTRATAVSRN